MIGMGVAQGASQDLENTFQGLKKGAFIRLEMQNGSSIQGRFSAYDDYYGRVWLTPEKDEGTLFRTKSIRLSSIRHVETIRLEPPKALADALMDPYAEFELHP
jgi:hypothetical protein